MPICTQPNLYSALKLQEIFRVSGGPTGIEVVRYRRLDKATLEMIRPNRAERLRFLGRNAHVSRASTVRIKMCSCCRGIGRAVVEGDLLRTFCVVAEAQQFAVKGSGT